MKYKLIKEYPGSPKLDTICKYDKNPWSDSNAFTNPVLNPQNYPEFWQPVVEEDYEILSFINLDNHIIYDEYQGIYRNGISTRPVHHCLEFYKIHSVKRLLDGAVFTVGEKVKFQGIGCSDISHISRIIIEKNCLYICSAICQFPIKFIEKTKQPIFQTEDSVDIFEGDNIYWVNINTFEKVNCNKFNDDLGEISIKSLLSKKYECKAVGFSTKKKAEEYIIMNKPCLSINDVNVLKNIVFANWDKTLKDLVKSKI